MTPAWCGQPPVPRFIFFEGVFLRTPPQAPPRTGAAAPAPLMGAQGNFGPCARQTALADLLKLFHSVLKITFYPLRQRYFGVVAAFAVRQGRQVFGDGSVLIWYMT